MICSQPSEDLCDDLLDERELAPERIRAALLLNKWGGRLAAAVGALLPACILLVWSYFKSLRGEGSSSPANSVGVVLSMAYFAVLQYMIFVVTGTVLKTRYELNRQMADLRLAVLNRTVPDDPSSVGQPTLSPVLRRSAAPSDEALGDSDVAEPVDATPAPSRQTSLLADRLMKDRPNGPSPADRRRLDRIDLRGVTAKCSKAGMLSRFVWGDGKICKVLSLSRGGLALSSGKYFRYGDLLNVELLSPNEDPLRLVAQVRWEGRKGNRPSGIVGVGFLPFNDQKGCNSKDAYQGLLRVEETYKALGKARN